MQDDGDFRTRRGALSEFSQAAVVITMATATLFVAEPLLEKATLRQAATQRQEALENYKRLSTLARQEQAAAARLAADAQKAEQAAAEAERYAEAARMNRLYTSEQIEEARASAQRLSEAAEAAQAKGRAATMDRIRAEDSAMSRQRQLEDGVERLRLFRALVYGAAFGLSWYGLNEMERMRQASAPDEVLSLDAHEKDRQRSAPDIFWNGLSNLADDPLGWFYGAPSPLYSSSLQEEDREDRISSDLSGAPPPVAAEPADVTSTKGIGGGEVTTRDPEPTAYRPSDPQAKQLPESFAEYLAKRNAIADNSPPPTVSPSPAPASTAAAPPPATTPSPNLSANQPANGQSGRIVPTSMPSTPASAPDAAAPMAAAAAPAASAPKGGKGFGGGEATRDPEPTRFDPDDPKARQQAIPKVETFAEYLARRNAAAQTTASIGDGGTVEPPRSD